MQTNNFTLNVRTLRSGEGPTGFTSTPTAPQRHRKPLRPSNHLLARLYPGQHPAWSGALPVSRNGATVCDRCTTSFSRSGFCPNSASSFRHRLPDEPLSSHTRAVSVCLAGTLPWSYSCSQSSSMMVVTVSAVTMDTSRARPRC